MAWRILSIPKTHPFAFGTVFSAAKTSFSDLLVQFQLENKRLEDVDWNRNLSFALFGFFYLGGVQYALYVPGFGRMFPNAASFAAKSMAEKLKDPVGWRNMGAQVFLDQCVHHPLLYFPVFYSLKEVVAGGNPMDGIAKYRKNMFEDMQALWKVWIPMTTLNFTFSPMWMRIPVVAMTSLVWTCILSAMRGRNDAVLDEKEAMDAAMNQGRALIESMKSHTLDPTKGHLIVSAHAHDRPGIVHTLTETLNGLGASISESKMIRMGGHFMVMMLVSVDEGKKGVVRTALQDAGGSDLEVTCNDVELRQGAGLRRTITSIGVVPDTDISKVVVADIHVSGSDRPGIVAEVTKMLLDNHCNIERMETTVKTQLDGTSVFQINGLVNGMQTDREALLAAADKLHSEQNVKVAFDFKSASPTAK